jgi:hypothetical protein
MLAPFVASGVRVAAEHVHEADAHHAAFAHHHTTPHHIVAHGHATSAEWDEDDLDRVIWLDGSTVPALTTHIDAPLLVTPAAFNLTPDLAPGVWKPTDAHAPAHGPPRAQSSLRGPPHTSA